MPFSPDIRVTDPETPKILLVAGVLADAATLPDVEPEFKVYVADYRCPDGMLVTPETARFYRNRYLGEGAQDVELIGECPTFELLDVPRAWVRDRWELADRVQHWLDDLRENWGRTWPSSVREAIDFDVRPIVLEGMVRASGSRLLRKTG